MGIERSGAGSGEQAVAWSSLSEATTEAWERSAREQQLTLSAVVQGAWALLLSRYSGKEDVVYGELARANEFPVLPDDVSGRPFLSPYRRTAIARSCELPIA